MEATPDPSHIDKMPGPVNYVPPVPTGGLKAHKHALFKANIAASRVLDINRQRIDAFVAAIGQQQREQSNLQDPAQQAEWAALEIQSEACFNTARRHDGRLSPPEAAGADEETPASAATPPSPSTASQPEPEAATRERRATATLLSTNMAGFAAKRQTQAVNRAAHSTTQEMQELANEEMDKQTLLNDYTLTGKHQVVLECMRSNTTVALIQEYNGSPQSASATIEHMRECGVDGYISLPRQDDRAAGLTFLWRRDMWTLLGTPVVHVPGRAATIHLRSEVDQLSYRFTNVYTPQKNHSTERKREFGRKLVDALAGMPQTEPHIVAGDFNGVPPELSRNATVDPNTTTLSELEAQCRLTRVSPDTDTYFWSHSKPTTLHAINWRLAKDEAAATTSVHSLHPEHAEARLHNLADGRRFVLLPASMLDHHYAIQNHPTKTATVFATLQPSDTTDRRNDLTDLTHNGELHLHVEPVVESMPQGMVHRRQTIQWSELYPSERLEAHDDRNLIRVLRANFSPFAQRFQVEETIDLHELHDTPNRDDPQVRPEVRHALELNLRQRGVTPKSGSTCIDHVLTNGSAKNMLCACNRGAPLGKTMEIGTTYHLTTYVTFNLTPRELTLPSSEQTGKRTLKLREVATKLGGWDGMQGLIVSKIAHAIATLARDVRTHRDGPAAIAATAPLTPDTPPDVTSTNHGNTPDALLLTAEQTIAQTIHDSNAFAASDEAPTPNRPARPNTDKLIRDMHTIGGIQATYVIFDAANEAIAQALTHHDNDKKYTRDNARAQDRTSPVQRNKNKMDAYIQVRGQITTIKKEADMRRHIDSTHISRKHVNYITGADGLRLYSRNAIPVPLEVQHMHASSTRQPKDMSVRAAYQRAYDRAVQEECILTKLIGELHAAMWEMIGEDRAKSQARRLQEILDATEHRNFVAVLWQHWRSVDAEKLIAPPRLPLARVRDTTQPDQPPIPPSDPRYHDTVRNELERLWKQQPTNARAIVELAEITGIVDEALPMPEYLDAVAEITKTSNVRKSVNKIRANAATGPDRVHGYCAKKGGEMVVALLKMATTLTLLKDNADHDRMNANLALVHKEGRDPYNPAASHRPLVVFNHKQVFFERMLQDTYNRHVEAVRSNCQAAFIPNTTTPALNWVPRVSAELAMFQGEERTEASSDARSFYDCIQLMLQMVAERIYGIPQRISERVRHTTATTSLSTRTAGGIVRGIAVQSGAGQGRSLATAKSQLVLIARERLAAQTAPGERFDGHQNTHTQHGNRAFADDECTSARGPLSRMHAELAQEASAMAADIVMGCPNNPDKSIMSNTTRDVDNNLIHHRHHPIVLPNGPGRTPAPMDFTTKPSKNVGIYTDNGIEHATTDNSRTRTINVFTKKATAQGGLLYTEIVGARQVISLGTNFFKMRVTIGQVSNSRAIDRTAQREDVAAGFAHHSTKLCVRHAPARAYGTNIHNDEATARAAFVDDLLRTLNLPPGVPWKDALEAYLTKYLWLTGNNEGAPLAFTPPTTRQADAEIMIGPYFYQSLQMAGIMLQPSHAPTNSALDPDRAPTREAHLHNALQLWHGIDIKDAHITTVQRLIALGLRYVEDLIIDVCNERNPDDTIDHNPTNRSCTLMQGCQAEAILGGSAHGHAPVTFNAADLRAIDQLTREVLHSRTAQRALRDYADKHAHPPAHITLAQAMNSAIGQRPVIIHAYLEPRPDGAARTRGLTSQTGKPGMWAPTRAADTPTHDTCRSQPDSLPRYLVRTAANLYCGAEGRWLTHIEVTQHCENAATALANLEPTLDAQMITNTLLDVAEAAMLAAYEMHTIPGPYYDHAAANLGEENDERGNVWQRLHDADPDATDTQTCALLRHFTQYARLKAHPRSTTANGSQTSQPRKERAHPVPDYQTYGRGTRNTSGKQDIGPQSSEKDREMHLRCLDDCSVTQLLELETSAALRANRPPLQALLHTADDRLFAGDNGATANPHFSNQDIQLNPITDALTRDKRIEPRDPNSRAPWDDSTNAISTTGETFRVEVEKDELAGTTAAADKKLAMVMLAAQHMLGGIDLIRFTDGAYFPDPDDPTKALHVGWGMVRATTKSGTRLDKEPRYTGNALTTMATIGRAELTATIHAMLDLKTYSEDRRTATGNGAANMIVCMDSDSCAMEMEDTLRAGNHESLTKYDDAQLLETIDNLRADLHRSGCKVVVIKVPGHARPEHEIGAVTQQAYADATAKAAAHLPTYTDPHLVITRGPHILVAQENPNQAGTDPNTGYSTIGTGTRTSKTVTHRLQSHLSLNAIRADDAAHDATTGRSAIDRIEVGADPKPKRAGDTYTKPQPRHPITRHPPSTAKTPEPTSSQTLSLHQPQDTKVWRELIEDVCSGRNVRRPPDSQPGGFAWLGQAIGQGSITYRCKDCPACGQRADARHIITNECPYFRVPNRVRNTLRQILCVKIGTETLKLDSLADPDAHHMAQTIEKAADTLFGNKQPPPRDDAGWCTYTRSIRVLAGGLPEPSSSMIRNIKDSHNADFDSHAQPERATTNQPIETDTGDMQNEPPRAATSLGAMNAEKLKAMRDDFMTTALKAARLTPTPPNTAPPPAEPDKDSQYDQDAHIFTPRRPDNTTTAYVRTMVMNDLRYMWEILAKILNAYEQILNTAADDKDTYDGRRANDEDENENYKRGKANRESNGPNTDRSTRQDKRRADRETREASSTQTRAPKAAPTRDYRTAGFGERRYRGPTAIDAEASSNLDTAHADGTDGLQQNDDTRTVLTALARHNDPYAAIQLTILARPGPSTNAEPPEPLPRHPPSQYANPTTEAQLHAQQHDQLHRTDTTATFARETQYQWNLRETLNLNAPWQRHNIAQEHWSPDVIGMTNGLRATDHGPTDTDTHEPDVARPDPTMDERPPNAEANDEPEMNTRTKSVTDSTDAALSQHDSAADADDEEEATPTHNPQQSEVRKRRRQSKTRRGIQKNKETIKHARQRIGRAKKRTEQQPVDPSDVREAKRPRTPDARHLPRPPVPSQPQPSNQQPQAEPPNRPPTPRPPKRLTEKRLASPSRRPRSTHTDRQASRHEVEETNVDEKSDDEEEPRSHPTAPQSKRPPSSQ